MKSHYYYSKNWCIRYYLYVVLGYIRLLFDQRMVRQVLVADYGT